MDNILLTCYPLSMNNQKQTTIAYLKSNISIVLPTEAFQSYVEHPIVRRLYLTDIGYFPKANHHFRQRNEGIDTHILFTVWRAVV